MNIYITLDYELFFGSRSGTIEACIIKPTEELIKITSEYGVRFVCFVDAGYLMALKRQMNEFPSLVQDYNLITNQLQSLVSMGHGIELHIHPHWEDSFFDGNSWKMDTGRYKLSDFNDDEVLEIISRYRSVLEKASGRSPVAYRAGGWSAQPFGPIRDALRQNNIFIDSTVYPQGYYISDNQIFDFRKVPAFKTSYNFEEDLTIEKDGGSFMEVPISSLKLSPLFFLKFAARKLLKQNKHKAYGDGTSVSMSKKEAFRLLTRSSFSVVSIDGYKSSFIMKAFKKYLEKTDNKGEFVLIGHPKAFTEYSLAKLKDFIDQTYQAHQYCLFNQTGLNKGSGKMQAGQSKN